MASTERQDSLPVIFFLKTVIALMLAISLMSGYYTQRLPKLNSIDSRLPPLRAIIESEGDNSSVATSGHKDQADPSVSTPFNPPRCPTIQLLPKHSVPLVALNSAPGAGNTWTRYMLEQATRIYTGSVYVDRSLIKGGFIGEREKTSCNCTVAVKIHWFSTRYPWKAIIHIMRNPYDAMLAERNRLVGKGHTSIATDPGNFRGQGWKAFVRQNLKRWEKIVKDAFKASDQLLIVHYEDLKSDTERELGRMLKFLEGISTKFISRADIRCALRSTTGNFKRPKHTLSFDPYTPDLRQIVDGFIRRVLEKLRKAKAPLPPYASEYPTNSTKR